MFSSGLLFNDRDLRVNSTDAPADAEQTTHASPRRGLLSRWREMLVILVAVSLIVGIVLYLQESTLDEAVAALNEGKLKLARYRVEQFLKRNPEHGRANTVLAQILVRMNEPQRAVQIFNTYQAATPDEAHAWARAHLMLRQWAQAIPLLQRVVEAKPTDEDALYELTSARIRIGQPDEALKVAQRLEKVKGSEQKGCFLTAVCYSDLRQHENAAKTFERLLKDNPDATGLQVPPYSIFLQYGNTLLFMGKADAARKWIERSIALKKTAPAYVALGETLLKSSDDNAESLAELAWRSCLELDYYNGPARQSLADLALQNDKPDVALQILNPLEKSNRIDSATAYMIERAYRAMKNEELAKKWAARTAELRRSENTMQEAADIVRTAPNSYWGFALRARQFAEQENWSQAKVLLTLITEKGIPDEPFIKQLAKAVGDQSLKDLPPLSLLPLQMKKQPPKSNAKGNPQPADKKPK